MDKINNISFTGIKNVAGCQFQRNRQSFSTALSMCLTDDVNGKDLSEFHSMIKKLQQNQISSSIITVQMLSILNIMRKMMALHCF